MTGLALGCDRFEQSSGFSLGLGPEFVLQRRPAHFVLEESVIGPPRQIRESHYLAVSVLAEGIGKRQPAGISEGGLELTPTLVQDGELTEGREISMP